MTYTLDQWKAELRGYESVKQIIDETLIGLEDQFQDCSKEHTRTVAVQTSGRRGLPPFREEPMVCDRGTSGCNKIHNDFMALQFAEAAFQELRHRREKLK